MSTSGKTEKDTVVWLYSRFGDVRAVAEATGIPYSRVLQHLKDALPRLAIEEPETNEIEVLVIELGEDTKRALNLTPENMKKVENILRSHVARLFSNPEQLRGLTLQKNHIVILLTKAGFNLLERAAKKSGLGILEYVNELAMRA
jgi:hypothetical protein